MRPTASWLSAIVASLVACAIPNSAERQPTAESQTLPAVGDVSGYPLQLPGSRVDEPRIEVDASAPGPLVFEIADDGLTEIDLDADVLFETGSHALQDAAARTLEQLLEAINTQAPEATLFVVGHTDSRGSAADNEALSQRRAEAVVDWFVGRGFPRDRMTARGRGESEPAEPDVTADGSFDPEAGRANRRVVIVVDAT